MENEFFFPPYKGDSYGSPDNIFDGKRVFALGHSHYCKNGYNPELKDGRLPRNRTIIRCDRNCANYGTDLCPNRTGQWTKDAADNFVNSGLKDSTDVFTKFARILNCNGKEKEIECWKSLAHYNFMQAAVADLDGDGNNTEIDFSRTLVAKAFKELAPDIIIVWGERKVFNHVFKYLPPEFMWTPGKQEFPCGTIRIGDKTAKVICIDHPAASRYPKIIDTERIRAIAPELYNK